MIYETPGNTFKTGARMMTSGPSPMRNLWSICKSMFKVIKGSDTSTLIITLELEVQDWIVPCWSHPRTGNGLWMITQVGPLIPQIPMAGQKSLIWWMLGENNPTLFSPWNTQLKLKTRKCFQQMNWTRHLKWLLPSEIMTVPWKDSDSQNIPTSQISWTKKKSIWSVEVSDPGIDPESEIRIRHFLNPMSELIPGFPYSLLIGPIAVVIYFVYSIFKSIKSGSQSVIKNEKEKK